MLTVQPATSKSVPSEGRVPWSVPYLLSYNLVVAKELGWGCFVLSVGSMLAVFRTAEVMQYEDVYGGGAGSGVLRKKAK